MEYYQAQLSVEIYHSLLNHLKAGDAERFAEVLRTEISRVISVFDNIQPKDTKFVGTEDFYHGFMFFLSSGLSRTHHSNSNRESGEGRLTWF